MKVLNFIPITLLSSILVVSTAFGNNGSKTTSCDISVRDQIGASLSEVSVDNNGIVFIYFNASPKDGFKLLQVKGSDNNLVQSVKRQLEKGSFVVPDCMVGSFILKIKIDNNIFTDNSVPADEVLRNIISDELPKVNVPKGSITLYFNVDENKLDVKRVEGTDKSLVSLVENSLNNSTVILPNEIAGKNFKIEMKF